LPSEGFEVVVFSQSGRDHLNLIPGSNFARARAILRGNYVLGADEAVDISKCARFWSGLRSFILSGPSGAAVAEFFIYRPRDR
jgi:hypothetical protein